jgi:hypothetical protein
MTKPQDCRSSVLCLRAAQISNATIIGLRDAKEWLVQAFDTLDLAVAWHERHEASNIQDMFHFKGCNNKAL